jgi:hypothetical protein
MSLIQPWCTAVSFPSRSKGAGKDIAQPSASTTKSAARASLRFCADQLLVGLLANADQCRGPCASKLLSFPHAIERSDSNPAQQLDAAMVLGHSVL